MSFSRRQLLLSSSAALLASGPVRGQPLVQRPKRLVYVFADGGWDTSYCIDPKPRTAAIDGPWFDEDASNPDDVEYFAQIGEYRIALNDYKRPSVTQFFRQYGPRCSVVAGIWTGAIAHDTSRVRILTGTTDANRPDLGTIVGASLGSDLALGCVDLSGLSLSGHLAASTGQVGFQSQIGTLLNPVSSFPRPKRLNDLYEVYTPNQDERAMLRAHLNRRTERFGMLHGDSGHNDQRIADRLESMQRADRFFDEGRALLQDLTPGKRPTLDLQIRLGTDLLKNDLCRSIVLETGQHWDSHDNNERQHEYFEETFRGLNLLAEELDAKGLAEDTLVLVISEMSRTPLRNGRNGKDHWPHSAALIFGAGFPTGRLFGGTTNTLESQAIDLASGSLYKGGSILKYDNFAAGMLAGFDIDPGDWYPGVEPFTGWFSS